MKILFLLLLLLLPLNAKAVGVAVNPNALDLILPGQETLSLTVKNISLEPVLVYIYADDFKENIKVKTPELKLLPEEIAKVELNSNFSNTKAGILQTNISVVTRAVDKQSFNAASGIKIPLTINIARSYWQWSGAMVFLITFISLLVLFVVYSLTSKLFKPKKKKFRLLVDLAKHHKKSWWKL